MRLFDTVIKVVSSVDVVRFPDVVTMDGPSCVIRVHPMNRAKHLDDPWQESQNHHNKSHNNPLLHFLDRTMLMRLFCILIVYDM
jgi:hypothetical protein